MRERSTTAVVAFAAVSVAFQAADKGRRIEEVIRDTGSDLVSLHAPVNHNET